jgi:thiomorpholine-carboxylate dehydrogenase
MEYFEEEKVRRLLRIEKLIPAMRQALAEFSAGKWKQPLRRVLAQHRGFFGAMPASGDSMGIKMVTFYPDNAGTNLPTHMAVIALFDPRTGETLALMDGRYITEMRTAAVSAVATDALARSDASVLTLLGAGVQAQAHLELFRGSGDSARFGFGIIIPKRPRSLPKSMASRRWIWKLPFAAPTSSLPRRARANRFCAASG